MYGEQYLVKRMSVENLLMHRNYYVLKSTSGVLECGTSSDYSRITPSCVMRSELHFIKELFMKNTVLT